MSQLPKPDEERLRKEREASEALLKQADQTAKEVAATVERLRRATHLYVARQRAATRAK